MSLAHERYEDLKARKLLWHYTSWESLLSILKSGELWASDYRVMNDTTEMLHTLQFCRGKFAGKVDPIDSLIASFLDRLDEWPTAYLVSMSPEFDSLEQWRAYDHNSIGVALGFNATRIESRFNEYYFGKVTCLYEADHKKNAIERICEDWSCHENQRREGLEAIPAADERKWYMRHKTNSYQMRDEYESILHGLLLKFKHVAFEKEKEIRFVSHLSTSQSDGRYRFPVRGFARRGTTLVPYLRIDLGSRTEDDPINSQLETHPLEAVLIGPTANPELVSIATDSGVPTFLQELLSKDKKNLGLCTLTVSNSEVPLRA